MKYSLQWENLKRAYKEQDAGIDCRIILIWILKQDAWYLIECRGISICKAFLNKLIRLQVI